MLNKTELLNKFSRDPEERIVLAHALDRMELARTRAAPAATKFLSPELRARLEGLLRACCDSSHLFFGGYEGAERTICAFLPDWQSAADWLSDPDKPMAAVQCTFPAGSGLTHRDFLGGLMGTGLARACIGDILVRDGACDILVLRESLPTVLDQFSSAGRFRLRTAELPLDALAAPVKQVKCIRDTVAALRLDAVVAAGFSLSRSKAAGLIQAGRASLNYQECLKPDKLVEEGDVFACRGLGKCVLKSVLGQSRKGRIMVEMERYV